MTVESMKQYLSEMCSEERFSHSCRVADTACRIAEGLSFPPEDVFIAGLLHDIAREIPLEETVRLAETDLFGISEYEYMNPVLLHGRAGAVMIQELFKVENDDIVNAVRFHTTLRPSASPLEKIVFIADYIEPERTHCTKEFKDRIFAMDLNYGCYTILQEEIKYRGTEKMHQRSMHAFKELSAALLQSTG